MDSVAMAASSHETVRGRMQILGRTIYWILTALALLLAGFAVYEFGAAETAKGNPLMRVGLLFIGAVALWSFARAILRALAGK